MEKYLKIIQEIVPETTLEDTQLPFNAAGITSFDLVTVRVEFEREIGKTIPDSNWMRFESAADIIEYCRTQEALFFTEKTDNGTLKLQKEVTIDMPQMAIEALSESWLFKELGNLHWQMLCDGLHTPSFNLKDELDNRLYATFVRIRIQSTTPLNGFRENEKLAIDGSIQRYGHSMYYSTIQLQSTTDTIEANLMTSFSIRNHSDNTKLVKSQPYGVQNSVEDLTDNPAFGNEYRLIKKGELTELTLGDAHFTIHDEVLFETTYTLNPYYDLNGVGLLYFAAYPIISDVCEARYFNSSQPAESRWELSYYTQKRDILYYGNCNINDQILYRLHAYHSPETDLIQISSSLYRKSDLALIARVFSMKRKKI